ncbi:MAG: DsbA family protein [Candidatus Diapherotrites archaeon]|nr:DsbA family protein [Candidatus Diapherotrites archaeon]
MSRLKEVKKEQQQAPKGFDWSMVILGVAGLFVLGFLYLLFFVPAGPASGGSVGENLVDPTDPFKGPVDAKVTIVEFSDFQCPACGEAYKTLKALFPEYSDRIKFVYKDFPLTQIHPYAQKAAEAGQCALEQGKFWEMHDKMFENQTGLSVSNLKNYAAEIGLEAESFNSCLDSAKMAGRVSSDASLGLRIGVNGTPTFYINGTRYQNMPIIQFRQAIDAELAK